MKYLLSGLLSVLLFIPLFGQSGDTYYVNAGTLNLRSAPNTDSDVVEQLPRYSNVIYLSEVDDDGWIKVRFDENEGYVAKQYLKKGKAKIYTTSYRVGARCKDGTRSSATGRGACSHHGGVDYWITKEKKNVQIVDE